jgi:hypothetical protein
MTPPRTKAAGLGTRTAFRTAHETHHSARPNDEQGGKSFAFFLYHIGAASLAETRRKFAANPAWRHA